MATAAKGQPTRRPSMIKVALFATILICNLLSLHPVHAKKFSVKGKNVVLIIIDQMQQLQNFPPGWSEQNLPGK